MIYCRRFNEGKISRLPQPRQEGVRDIRHARMLIPQSQAATLSSDYMKNLTSLLYADPEVRVLVNILRDTRRLLALHYLRNKSTGEDS